LLITKLQELALVWEFCFEGVSQTTKLYVEIRRQAATSAKILLAENTREPKSKISSQG
jgi:hypothetical protein